MIRVKKGPLLNKIIEKPIKPKKVNFLLVFFWAGFFHANLVNSI